MPPQLESRIASLKAKKDALAVRLNALQAKAKSEDRKRDTRRKIVVGAAVIAAMEKDDALARRVRELLARSVTRPNGSRGRRRTPLTCPTGGLIGKRRGLPHQRGTSRPPHPLRDI